MSLTLAVQMTPPSELEITDLDKPRNDKSALILELSNISWMLRRKPF